MACRADQNLGYGSAEPLARSLPVRHHQCILTPTRPCPRCHPQNPLYETAQSALDKSCYTTIDWKISEDSMVIDAIHRMVANDIGALAVTHKVHGDVIGVISERDYLNKVSEGRFIHER